VELVTVGKWAIKQVPRCYLKRHAVNRNYRNDWCEYGGKCDECLIAKDYNTKGFFIMTSEMKAMKKREEIQEGEE